MKNKLVGLHTGRTKKFNLGTFLNYPIKDFINEHFNDKDDKNEKMIKILLMKKLMKYY